MTVTQRLHAHLAADLLTAADLLRAGGLVAFPTDTVYGLGTGVWNVASIARIFQAKERPPDKAIPVLVANLAAAEELAAGLPEPFVALARRFWPGPLTLVTHANDRLPDILTAGGGTVALRAPAHPAALALLERAGPLAVTSANRSGAGSLVLAADVLEQLDGRIDAVLDGGECPGGAPSTIFDLTQTPPRVLRAGPVSASELDAVLQQVERAKNSVRIAA